MRLHYGLAALVLFGAIGLLSMAALVPGDDLYNRVTDSIEMANGSGVVNFNPGTFDTLIAGIPVTWDIPQGAYANVSFAYMNYKLSTAAATFCLPVGAKGGGVKLRLGQPVQFEGELRAITYKGTELRIESTLSPVRTTVGTPPLKPAPDLTKPLISVLGNVSPINAIVFTAAAGQPALTLAIGKPLAIPMTAGLPIQQLPVGSKAVFSNIKYAVTSQELSGTASAISLPIDGVSVTFPNVLFAFKMNSWNIGNVPSSCLMGSNHKAKGGNCT